MTFKDYYIQESLLTEDILSTIKVGIDELDHIILHCDNELNPINVRKTKSKVVEICKLIANIPSLSTLKKLAKLLELFINYYPNRNLVNRLGFILTWTFHIIAIFGAKHMYNTKHLHPSKPIPAIEQAYDQYLSTHSK